MPQETQVAYRQLPAKQRQRLRKQALLHAPSSLFGLTTYEGNLDAFSEYLRVSVLDSDKHGATVRIAGPVNSHTLKAKFKSGRLGPSGDFFQFLYYPDLTAHLVLDCFGLGYWEGKTLWAFALEDAATNDERFAKFLRLVKSSCRNCHLLNDDKVARIYQLNDTHFVEYVDLINHPGRVVVSSLDSFIGGYDGLV